MENISMDSTGQIGKKFAELREKQEMACIIYLTAGFPSLKESIQNMRLLSESGADIIEIGVPFSDPVADGPTIQYSSQIALENGVTLKMILEEIKKLRVDIPLVLMSYLNPLLAYGKEILFKDMREAKLSGIIIPDLPAEEAEEWVSLSKSYDIDFIFLVAPTSSEKRIKQSAERSEGFIYCVSIAGTTGVREELPTGLLEFIQRVRNVTDKPIAVGFGISRPDQVTALWGKADGVIIGSRIIDVMRQGGNIKETVKKLKEATRRQGC